jgi:hypothetical protein
MDDQGQNSSLILSNRILVPQRSAGRTEMGIMLFVLAVVVAVAGLVTIGFGIQINNEYSLGTTLIIAGTTAVTGGLVLLGLSATVSELRRIAEGLHHREPAQAVVGHLEPPDPFLAAAAGGAPAAAALEAVPVARAPQPNISILSRPPDVPPREAARALEPYSAPASAMDVSSAAMQRPRSSIPRSQRTRTRTEPSEVADPEAITLAPNLASASAQNPAKQSRREMVEPVPLQPRRRTEDCVGDAAVEALKGSPLDFLFRLRPAPPAGQSDPVETTWPGDARREGSPPAATEPRPRTERIETSTSAPVSERVPAPAASDGPRSSTIVKSGVVDGMAYTLYADGSIEAKLPSGSLRFGSINELRTHIESKP